MLEKTESAIKNGQYNNTGNIRNQKEKEDKHNK